MIVMIIIHSKEMVLSLLRYAKHVASSLKVQVHLNTVMMCIIQQCCSETCSNKLRCQTCQDRYDVDVISQSEEIKKKLLQVTGHKFRKATQEDIDQGKQLYVRERVILEILRSRFLRSYQLLASNLLIEQRSELSAGR